MLGVAAVAAAATISLVACAPQDDTSAEHKSGWSHDVENAISGARIHVLNGSLHPT